MKELSIEEKAKRYDEAIEKMQSMMKSWETLSYNGKTFLQDIKYIFPELKESEDEKIRKSLIKGFKRYFSESVFNGILVKDILAWLEKQGEKGINGKNREIPFSEQKPAWSEEDETTINNLVWAISNDCIRPQDREDYCYLLKTLKDRYTWKPSDKQMKQLGWVAEQNKDNMIGKELMSLYQDLKKLKDEK